ncbi:endonuclease domain-containing protein [Sphingomonas nostoxanthinifaciens]|uniref:endonuclease domain-containing protein n=1 Tax=Sphingomonas nostoxanthinifaciens TaxID=2872652 RepID=UPI0021DA8C8A|nr:endonuclease domain-containing protein [Sphingomonas nostoxanthinifaciens]
MRRFSTDAEAMLWTSLRSRRLAGAKFRRQVWLGQYIADFYCAEARLVVEADGSQHFDQADYDERRRAWLEQEGFRVIRFWNNEVLTQREKVLAAIGDALTLPPPFGRRAPPSPLQGEGR